MKRLLLAVTAMLAASAAAQPVYTAPTDDGQVVLTQEPCVIAGRPVARLLVAYGYDAAGQMRRGCWASEDGRIWVHWRDRGTETFAPGAFVARGKAGK